MLTLKDFEEAVEQVQKAAIKNRTDIQRLPQRDRPATRSI